MEPYIINELNVQAEDGSLISIRVLDIDDSDEFKKAFIIYTLKDDNNNIFASILNENENSYSLETITDEREIEYIRARIETVMQEEQEGELYDIR